MLCSPNQSIHCSLQSQQQQWWFKWWWLHLASVSVSAVKRQVVKLTVHVEDSPVDLNDSAVKAELLKRASSHSPPLHSHRLYVYEFADFEWKEQTLWLLSDRWRSSWRRKEWVESVWGGECSLMGSSWLEMEEERRLREKEKCFRSFSAWIMWQPIKLYYPHVTLPAVSEHRCGLTSVFRLFCHSFCGRGLFFGFHRDKCRRVCEPQVSADTRSLLEIRETNMLSPWKQAQEIQQAETVMVLALWVSGLCVYY